MNALDILKFKQKRKENIEKGLTTFINPFSYLFFRKNLNLFNEFDNLLIDGAALVYLLRIVGIKTSRYSFDMTSLAPEVFKKAIKENKTVYFIGSSQESINGFMDVIKLNYIELLVVGFRNGFFKDENEREKTLSNIMFQNPDIVISGMGTPLQELFLVDLKKQGWRGDGYTCGGFIHQTANRFDYYPRFYNKYNLRWLYRMVDEPKLIKRYFLLYPKSIILFFLDFIRNK